MNWDLTVLIENAEKLHGKEQKNLVIESSNSIIERQDYARFHYHEAVNIFNGYFENRKSLRESMDLVFRTNAPDYEAFDFIKKKTQAHIFGFMQSLHSVSDILSHVIYYSLGLNFSHQSKINIDYLTIHKLPKVLEEENTYHHLSSLIRELIENSEYKYLADVVNHSKHRSIIEPFFNVNLKKSEGEHHEIKFRGFNFKGATHMPRLVFEFMEPEFDRQSQLIIIIGNEINKIVTEKC
uniref:hypothetical protein n=1 Tax=Cellvibrio fontiphilus TaxID=1815559 RepID=UPI002B4BFD6D|nr:hypothetical protein [Cellvibrio fontiphilus]